MSAANSETKAATTKTRDYTSLAIRLKWQMNDIIDVAYQNKTPPVIAQLKRFTIYCTEDELRSKLGDCRWNAKDKTSRIRIFGLGKEGFREILITTMHEVSHHIDRSLRGKSGHDAPFYLAHKKLLFAAMDMGIISKQDVVYSSSKARNRDKLAKMMDEYKPNPVNYKQDKAQIFVYKAFDEKETLKARGYSWNSLDEAWMREINADDFDAEHRFLVDLGLNEKNIKIVKGGAVAVRLRKNARLFNVPYESNDLVKSYGFRWVTSGKLKYWGKKIDGEKLPRDEWDALSQIPGVKIEIT